VVREALPPNQAVMSLSSQGWISPNAGRCVGALARKLAWEAIAMLAAVSAILLPQLCEEEGQLVQKPLEAREFPNGIHDTKCNTHSTRETVACMGLWKTFQSDPWD
jgi:hypothetical protein